MSLDKPVLNTRPPTAAVPYPFVLLEGEAGAGKTWQLAELSKSPRVGRVFWLDLSEGCADEYAAIEGARYEVLVHDGTYAQVLEQVLAVKALARAASNLQEAPVVLCIDTMTDVWTGLKDWVSSRARAKPANQRKLAADPAAELDVSRNLWNDAGSRYRRLMTNLLTFPGIVVATAKGKEISGTDPATGQPWRDGRREWSVEGEKNLVSDATVVIRMKREEPPCIIKARSVHAGVKPGRDKPRVLDQAPENLIDWLVFDVLKCDPHASHARDYRAFTGGELTEDEQGDEKAQEATEARAAAAGPVTRPVAGKPAESAPVRPERDIPAPSPTEPAPAPVVDLVAEFLSRLDRCANIADFRAAWATSGEAGIRATEVTDPVHGTLSIGKLIMRRQAAAQEHATPEAVPAPVR